MASSPSSARPLPVAVPASDPLFRRGKDLLNDALSPLSRKSLHGLRREEQGGVPNSPLRRRSVVQEAAVWAQDSENFVQVECSSRPFGLLLALNRDKVIVQGFTPRDRSTGAPGIVERSRLVLPGDVLIAVNDESVDIPSVQEAEMLLAAAVLPVALTFRRVAPVRATLSQYSIAEIERQLTLSDSALLEPRSAREAALLVQACIEVLGNGQESTPLAHYIARVEQQALAPVRSEDRHEAKQQRLEQVKQVMSAVHERVRARRKEQVDQWNASKSSQLKRIEVLEQQRSSINAKLAKMRERRDDLHPENPGLWQEYIELRHLSGQLDETVEKAKQQHYLPDFEEYSLRFGSDGVYVGVGDIWIPSFHAKFTVETRSTAPHLFFHLSTPSAHGLKLRAKNFTLATEGRLPSFHCDELNVEAQLIADIPLNFDHVGGWQVPQGGLDVKLMSFVYYERQANSTKRGTDHDTMMRLFINRLLPTVVRHAVQALLCVELGPLIERRDAQVILTGEIRIHGKPLGIYDAALNTISAATSAASPSSGKTRDTNAKSQDVSELAREMLGISTEEADVLYTIFKSYADTRAPKRSLFTKTESPRFCIRNMIGYFDQFNAVPHLKALACELWGQSVQLATPIATPRSRFTNTSSPFGIIVDTLDRVKDYPVDVSISLVDVTFRLDLCEAGATFYTTLQRIIRQKMDSTSVGLSNFQDLRDGTYLENKLSSLDKQFNAWNRFLSYVTSNVDELGVIFRGGIPSGVLSKMFIEIHDLAAKGPCGGAVSIPLTDLAVLSSPEGLPLSKPTEPEDAAIVTRSHENGSLVFSRFFRDDLLQRDDGGIDGGAAAAEILPRDRIKVSVKNTAARILFEVPSDLSRLTPGDTLVPFALSVVTDDPGSPPMVRVETGEFAKCQYKADKISISGHLEQFVARAEEELQASAGDEVDQSTKPGDAESASRGTVWDDYLESPFFSVKFHFFTSCQVTREHLYWSIRSASLTEPKVVQLKHRLCLSELLQDLGMLSVVDSGAAALAQQKRVEKARMRRALRQDTSSAERIRTSFSNLSDSKTLFSRTSFTSTVDGDGYYSSEAPQSARGSYFEDDFRASTTEASSVSSDLHRAPPLQRRPSTPRAPEEPQRQLQPPLQVAVTTTAPSPSPPPVSPSSPSRRSTSDAARSVPPLGSKRGSAMFF